MKEISINKKLKIIKMFLSGSSYDDIVMEVGVAKGTDLARTSSLRLVSCVEVAFKVWGQCSNRAKSHRWNSSTDRPSESG